MWQHSRAHCSSNRHQQKGCPPPLPLSACLGEEPSDAAYKAPKELPCGLRGAVSEARGTVCCGDADPSRPTGTAASRASSRDGSRRTTDEACQTRGSTDDGCDRVGRSACRPLEGPFDATALGAGARSVSASGDGLGAGSGGGE
jgi:hypothetical protein